jgi:diphthamide synthase (EF-2-diphthine--ammonia ligase)
MIRKTETGNQMISTNKKTVKAVFNWSGGKDSALCLYKILQERHYEIISLLTTISQPYQRISMHGVKVEVNHYICLSKTSLL